MAGWKGTDPEKAMRSLEKALDGRHDPQYLEKIVQKAPLENIRKLAAEYKEELEGYAARAEKSDPKCPKCGAPLVQAPYYTAIKGQSTVSNVQKQWTLDGTKTTYTRNTPYSDLHLHTASFCPRCASRKSARLYYPTMVLIFGGLLAALAFGVMLLVLLISKNGSDHLFTVSLIGLAAGILAFWIGYKLMGVGKGVVSWAGKKKAPLTTEEFNARDRGTAFYGQRTQYWRVESYNSAYDISMQYITSRTLDKIPHEKQANTALSTGFVRQMQEKNGK